MRLVVHNAPFPFNHFANPRTRPHVTTKSIRFSTVGQQVRQQLFLLPRQFSGTTRMGPRL